VNTNFIRGDKAVETIGGVLTIDGSVFDSFTHLEAAILNAISEESTS
jgi:hypothetical protein